MANEIAAKNENDAEGNKLRVVGDGKSAQLAAVFKCIHRSRMEWKHSNDCSLSTC